MAIPLPPVIAELFPAIMGAVAGVGLWGLAMYTKRVARLEREARDREGDAS